ncbi:hypothetical protein JCM9140_4728 [Halalkalibacter wakoensis JCM 9140]|uniref:Uncharacterized protein n=1 Tax=Halalkalibacter wakoensis JCM 9140 TaxID=1236970 RepID=W4Q920_9BACI|nr:hypothetical protein JCM9140_4728 [Halalkalibacter wakoensis JCM 9140]
MREDRYYRTPVYPRTYFQQAISDVEGEPQIAQIPSLKRIECVKRNRRRLKGTS